MGISVATEFLTLREAATLLRLEPKTVSNLINKGTFKLGQHYYRRPGEIGIRFDKAALVDWLKEGNGEKQQGIKMARGYVLR